MSELQELMITAKGKNLSDCKRSFILRDYSDGIHVKFSTEISGLIADRCEREVWIDFITTINEKFAEASSVDVQSVSETILNCLTCYLSTVFFQSKYQKKLNSIMRYIEDKNKTVFIQRKLFVVNPMKKGLRVLEVICLNEFEAPPPQVLNNSIPLVPR
ncbi:Golgin subfamily A member 7/ERF4 domain-containing protein [Strongyloides ratti]|uniref:Ras modification protein ERF4 n=1 Tax=Strongyloides ratti TaxID=34506 RepID=A0A090KVL7_STRRB|nr:Golgin subfamily A member 7/ERF4 domain-containing protein [Strongyloides ratti]CEF59277.1 Golgin subfamily A member 7/ERF4 domain-containing protein [Strongyloides ratti]